jgi:hypothetical protein
MHLSDLIFQIVPVTETLHTETRNAHQNAAYRDNDHQLH